MDTIKIGKFLAELRREKGLTQEQLAEKLGTSNKTISRWENGNYMPPIEMLCELSAFYGVSINEILSGKRLDKREEKQAAEENLKDALSVSAFSLEERKAYFTKKWKSEHRFGMTLQMLVILAAMVFGFCLQEKLVIIIALICALLFSVTTYNRMMGYVERNVYDDPNKKSSEKF